MYFVVKCRLYNLNLFLFGKKKSTVINWKHLSNDNNIKIRNLYQNKLKNDWGHNESPLQ